MDSGWPGGEIGMMLMKEDGENSRSQSQSP